MTSEQASGTVAQAKDQAAGVAGTAREEMANVAGEAKDQVRAVAGEAAGQARNLAEQSKEQLRSQTADQQHRLAEGIRQLAEQFSQMASGGEEGSLAHSVVRQLADGGHQAAGYLEEREPGDLVAEVQRFGRRRPGAFLLGAALAGFAVARLGKAAKNAEQESQSAAGDGAMARPLDPYPSEVAQASAGQGQSSQYPTQPIPAAPFSQAGSPEQPENPSGGSYGGMA